MIWTIDIEAVFVWYWLVIGLFLLVGFVGTWVHKSVLPIMWAGLMSAILFIGANALAPLIFGYEYYQMYSLQWILVCVFGILFVIINAEYMYNILTKGTVIE